VYLVRKSFFEALRGGLLDLVGDVRFAGGVGDTLAVLVFVGGLHFDGWWRRSGSQYGQSCKGWTFLSTMMVA
jgi:hypothetical protein